MFGSDFPAVALGLGLLIVASLPSGAEPLACLAPLTPAANLTPALIATYRAEIRDEFETYFSEVTAYLTCLDGERQRVLTEAHATSRTYASILSTEICHEAPARPHARNLRDRYSRPNRDPCLSDRLRDTALPRRRFSPERALCKRPGRDDPAHHPLADRASFATLALSDADRRAGRPGPVAFT